MSSAYKGLDNIMSGPTLSVFSSLYKSFIQILKRVEDKLSPCRTPDIVLKKLGLNISIL